MCRRIWIFSVEVSGLYMDFAYNVSFATVNITQVLRKQTQMLFPIGQVKSLMANAHFMIFCVKVGLKVYFAEQKCVNAQL